MISLEPVLLALASRIRSPDESLSLTTTELGHMLGVSQQTASRYLTAIESKGWVERRPSGRGFTLSLTPEGLGVLRNIHCGLGRLLQKKSVKSFKGAIVSGIGEGAYYIGEYAGRIEEALGYMPYYGTLNIKFTGGKPDLTAYRIASVGKFKSGQRSFGGVDLVPVKLEVRGHTVGCHVIIPERTHHKKDLELIAKDNLRRRYGLKDGDAATVTIN